MTKPRVPWWYSGGEGGSAEPAEEPTAKQGDGFGLPGVDWAVLASGAQRLVDWATDRVMAPHAEHADPSEHAQCVVCRTMLLLGERSTAAPANDKGPEPGPGADDITWIPIIDE